MTSAPPPNKRKRSGCDDALLKIQGEVESLARDLRAEPDDEEEAFFRFCALEFRKIPQERRSQLRLHLVQLLHNFQHEDQQVVINPVNVQP